MIVQVLPPQPRDIRAFRHVSLAPRKSPIAAFEKDPKKAVLDSCRASSSLSAFRRAIAFVASRSAAYRVPSVRLSAALTMAAVHPSTHAASVVTATRTRPASLVPWPATLMPSCTNPGTSSSRLGHPPSGRSNILQGQSTLTTFQRWDINHKIGQVMTHSGRRTHIHQMKLLFRQRLNG